MFCGLKPDIFREICKMDDFGPQPESKAKSVRQIRIRHSDIEDKSSDPLMRHWIILSNLGEILLCSNKEDHLVRIFIDTGANCNTIARMSALLC